MPQRSVSELAVSTPSPGTVNSDVAVEPSVTVIVVGSNVIPVIVVEVHGLVTVMSKEVAVGVNSVVAP